MTTRAVSKMGTAWTMTGTRKVARKLTYERWWRAMTDKTKPR
jgi:hypothetical protein